MSLKPYEHMKECYYREIMTEDDFEIKEKGESAEDELSSILETKLPAGWGIHRNYWFNHSRNHEVDVLITNQKFILALECKNYSGKFDYKSDSCYLNGRLINDQVGINDNRKQQLQSILSENGLKNLPIYTAMIFMNNECDVNADVPTNFPLIMRYRLDRFIGEMINKFDQLQIDYSVNKIHSVLKKYQVPHPYPSPSLELSDFSKLRKGVHCKECCSYDLVKGFHDVSCSVCGFKESKSEAKKRSVAELGMLFYNEEKILTPKNITEFLAGAFSKKAISKELYKSWPSHGKYRGTYYHNYGLHYEQVAKLLVKDKQK